MNLSKSVKKIPHLELISKIAAKHKVGVWLVGGFLRDICIKKNKELLDFDFCVGSETFKIAKEFAKIISAKFIVLDKKNQCSRVILKQFNKLYTYDFTRMRGDSIYQDLSLRDFSINSLAVDLFPSKLKIIDYFKGRADLKAKVIRVMRSEVIAQDPLRILRGFSFSANYGFCIEAKTLKLMVKHKSLLRKVSAERILEELIKIFNCPCSYKIIKVMDITKTIDEVIPYISKLRRVSQGQFHHLGVWQHSIETLRQFERIYQYQIANNEEIATYLNEKLAGSRRRIHVVKLACLLHDIGKPLAKKRLRNKTIFHTHEKIGRDLAAKVADSLRLSLREKDILGKLIFWHLRPGYLADQVTPSERAIYHFFRDVAGEGIAVILLSLSDWRATRGPLTITKKRRKHEIIMLNLIDFYLQEKKKKPLPNILDGYAVMKKFKLKEGYLIGVILKKIREEQVLGKISTKKQAYKLAKSIIDKVNHR